MLTSDTFLAIHYWETGQTSETIIAERYSEWKQCYFPFGI